MSPAAEAGCELQLTYGSEFHAADLKYSEPIKEVDRQAPPEGPLLVDHEIQMSGNNWRRRELARLAGRCKARVGNLLREAGGSAGWTG